MKKIFVFAAFFVCAIFSAAAGTMYKSDVVASFYADKFNGRQTASGEIFDMNGFTAAHKELPFNTMLRVTNLANGKTVTVRVNDRGPFIPGREIDLSKAAASKLDMIAAGTAKVSIEIVGGPAVGGAAAGASADGGSSAPKETSAESESMEEIDADARWDIQLGAFSNKGNAKLLAQKLLADGFTNVVYQQTKTVTRVAIKDVESARLEALQEELYAHGYKDQVIRKRKAN